jgi:hypothetical protein
MPVPALPDTERYAEYSITEATGPYSVGFALYMDGDDYENWIEVRLDGEILTPETDYTLESPSGPLALLQRPITDGRIVLAEEMTGVLQIFGAARPRRLLQLAENQGVTAADFNRIVTSIVAMQREAWDRFFEQALRVPPGEVTDMEYPSAANRANSVAGFDGDGFPQLYTPEQSMTLAVRFDIEQALTAVQRDRARRNIGIVNQYSPEDFGAAGDGTTDDTDAIQDWFDAGGAGVLLVGSGTYKISSTIVITEPYITVRGSRMKILDTDPSLTNAVQVNSAATDFWMEGVEIDYNKDGKTFTVTPGSGTHDNTYCLSIRATRPTLINCVFRDALEHCVSIRKFDAEAGDLLEEPRVFNCQFYDSGNPLSGRGYGLWIFGNIRNSLAIGNFVKNCLGGGIGVDEASSGSPAGNKHYFNLIADNKVHAGGGAIRVEGTQYAAVIGNLIDNYDMANGLSGEQHACIVVRSIQQTGQISAAGNAVVVGNRGSSPFCAIDLQNPQDVVISANDFTVTNGGETTEANHAFLKCFKNNSTYAPRNVKITGNNFCGNVPGITFAKYTSGTPTTLPGVTIRDNTLTWTGDLPAASGFEAMDIDYCAAPSISGNKIQGGWYDGAVTRANNTGPFIYRDNEAAGCVRYGHQFAGDYEKIITGNYSKDALTADMRFENSARDNVDTIWRDNYFLTSSNAPNSNVQPDRLNKNVEGQVVTGGAEVTTKDLGAITTGTVTPDPSARAKQKYTNGGAHTLAPSAKHGSYTIDIENVSGAGAITVSGWTKVSGDPRTTTVGHKFRGYADIGAGGSSIVFEQLV